jgi:nucleotide-binding universal stress UspA family protein
MGIWQIETVNTMETFKVMENSSRNFLEKAKWHLRDTSIKTIQKEGDVAQMILETAHEIKADFVVMGSHSQKWLENIVMGSITEEVLRKSTVPMYIIPTKKRN